MATESPEKTFKPQGISFPADLLEAAKAAAKGRDRTLSAYVQQLIREDLERETADACRCRANPTNNQED